MICAERVAAMIHLTASGLLTETCCTWRGNRKARLNEVEDKRGEIGKVFKRRGKCSLPRLGERETVCLTGRTKESWDGCRGNWMTAPLWTLARGACCLLSLTTG